MKTALGLLLLGFALIACATAALVNFQDFGEVDIIPTPFGLRPRQCVHRNVGNGVTIREAFGVEGKPDAVEVVHEDGTVLKTLPVLPECVAWDKMMQKQRDLKQKNMPSEKIAGMPLNGWIDYTGYYPPKLVDLFYSFYKVPGAPANNGANVLFYFIGTQNMRTGTLSILQPVLTWGNGINGWSVASWNCCPGGQQHESTPLTGFGSGDWLRGTIQQTGPSWAITSAWQNQTTVLSVADAGRDFNWGDVTLEVYNVNSCADLATGPMYFADMGMMLTGGQGVFPQWQVDKVASDCNGKIVVVTPFNVTISHN